MELHILHYIYWRKTTDKMNFMQKSGLLWAVLLALSCNVPSQKSEKLFVAIPQSESGIAFANNLTENATQNIATYEYFYNGAGVAAGDVNGDGLPDLFFAGNMVPNKLYLNKGNLVFEDVTERAGLAGKKSWTTGVSMADVNGDGQLDLYVCYSGNGSPQDKANELYINQGMRDGIPIFEEKAAELGLDAPGSQTTHMVFFDMDGDNDLDALMVNHALEFYNVFINTSRLRRLRSPEAGNRLYRNDNGFFTDISEQAGIDGTNLNFGLGAAVGDINGDGKPDIYVTNDYNEQDFLYLNNGDGTFTDCLKKSMPHTSLYSMGVDMADINNDGLLDVVTLDMLPEDHYRQKILKGPDGYDTYQRLVDSGFHHQQMRNMLQLNMGVHPDGKPRFSEIGQMAGISRTDWSWSPLIADFDLDGHKDLFITNGYLRNFTDLDFLKYTFPEAQAAARQNGNNLPIWEAVKNLTGTPVANYFYKNSGTLLFENATRASGLDAPMVSTGAAWADLDGDGDVELITNNTNAPASIWKNNSVEQGGKQYITLALQGPGANTQGIGATISISYETGEGLQIHQLMPNKGYQSSVEPRLHIGLGKNAAIPQLKVHWPDGTTQVVSTPLPGKLNTIAYKPDAIGSAPVKPLPQQAFLPAGLTFEHKALPYIDFKQNLLLPHQISRQGPFMARADVNGDGLEDILITGNALQGTTLFLQQANGSFVPAANQPWQPCGPIADGAVAFLDADSDGDADLYISKMGMQLPEGDSAYQHKLYINNGKGLFTEAKAALPPMAINSTSVTVADYNRDGKADLYAGGRAIPGRYPVVPTSYLLKNVSSGGKVRFEYAREQPSQVLRQSGLVTTSTWADVNSDGWPDLLVGGECMPIRLFINEQGLIRENTTAGFANSDGWWSSLLAADVNGDGHVDLLSGNLGLNSPIQVNPEQPATLWYNDWDGNGSIDPILVHTIGNHTAPALTLDDLAEQVPLLRKQFNRYHAFAAARWEDMFTPEKRQTALRHDLKYLRSCWWQNDGKGNFTRMELPDEVQFSPIMAIDTLQRQPNGYLKLLMAGNYYPWRIQWGQMDAGYGWVLEADQHGTYKAKYPWQTGFWATGDVRSMIRVVQGKNPLWLIVRHNSKLLAYKK